VIIGKPDIFIFIEADLSKSLFQGTDLQKVRFIGVKLLKMGFRDVLYEETLLEKGKAGLWIKRRLLEYMV